MPAYEEFIAELNRSILGPKRQRFPGQSPINLKEYRERMRRRVAASRVEASKDAP